MVGTIQDRIDNYADMNMDMDKHLPTYVVLTHNRIIYAKLEYNTALTRNILTLWSSLMAYPFLLGSFCGCRFYFFAVTARILKSQPALRW